MREFSLPALYEVPADGNLTDIVRRNAAQHPDVAVIARKSQGVWQDVTAREFLAEVRTAVPLTDDQQDRLKAALANATGKQLNLKVVVDPSVLGGIVATVGDTVIDDTVRTRIDQMKSRL